MFLARVLIAGPARVYPMRSDARVIVHGSQYTNALRKRRPRTVPLTRRVWRFGGGIAAIDETPAAAVMAARQARLLHGWRV